jgi:hypothetical protein
MSANSFSSQPTDAVKRSAAILNLRTSLCKLQHGLRLKGQAANVVSTGVSALDGILPDGGLLRGTLSEWIAAAPGSGAASLAMRVASQAQKEGPLIIVDRQKQFYAPAFPATGVCLNKTILVRPESRGDELWVVEKALRCPGVGAVVCQLEHLRLQEYRRLQLAAESGTAVGLLIRPASVRRQSGWASVRLLVSPRPSAPRRFRRCLEVRCLYVKGGLADRTVQLEVCDETNTVCVAAEISHSATAQATGA